MESERVEHAIEPVFDERSKVLVLGTMPSPVSRETGFFYGHPHNRFWRVLASVFDEPAPETVADKRDMLLRHGIALWDVLASCDIEGASDASIRNARPNDLSPIFDAADIRAVFATGAKAGQLYARFCEKEYGIPCTTLPSTSPANARMRAGDLVDAYRDALLPHLPEQAPATLDVERVVALEQAISAAGTPLSSLMRRAGRALAKTTLDLLEEKRGADRGAQGKPNGDPASVPPREGALAAGAQSAVERGRPAPAVAVLCGFGNNGGDGWVAAEALADAGCEVRVVTPCPAEDLKAEPARSAALRAMEAFGRLGGAAAANPALRGNGERNDAGAVRIAVNPNAEELARVLEGADAVVDAMLGTGFSGDAVREPFASWIRRANAARLRGSLVIAADVPSGLSAQTGKAADPCLKADLTLTMMTLKPGLVTPYAFAFCGEVRVAPIAYIEPLLEKISRHPDEDGLPCAADESSAPCTAGAAESGARGRAARRASEDETGPTKESGGAKRSANSEFYRAEAEDDDGYDPYSDRRPEPEPMFQRDPWA